MLGQNTYVIPVSNGILEHCARMGVAIWVFLWMLDRTTKEAPGADGQTEGLVYGGRPISARDIAGDLRMPARTVHAHLAHLLDRGYLRKISFGDGVPAGYSVPKSKKWALKKSISDLAENGGPSLNSANPSPKTAGGSPKMAGTSLKMAPIYRNNTLQHKTGTKTKSKASPFIVPVWLPLDSWNHYLEMRHGKHKDPTEQAKRLVVRELDKLRASGQDPGAVLDQSTRNGWTDVYELKGSSNGTCNGGKLSPGAARFKANQDANDRATRAVAKRLGLAEEDDGLIPGADLP